MHKTIADFFHENKIEYFSTLAYSDCNELDAEMMSREGFTPESVIVFLLPYYAGEGKNLS